MKIKWRHRQHCEWSHQQHVLLYVIKWQMIRFQALWKTKSFVKVCLKFKLPLWKKGPLIHLSPLWQLPLWHFPRWHNFPVYPPALKNFMPLDIYYQLWQIFTYQMIGLVIESQTTPILVTTPPPPPPPNRDRHTLRNTIQPGTTLFSIQLETQKNYLPTRDWPSTSHPGSLVYMQFGSTGDLLETRDVHG